MKNLFSNIPKARGAICLFILLILVTPYSKSEACFWDRDTTIIEAEQNPSAVRAIFGWFVRYPDLYYEMRLERIQKELAEGTDDPNLYDDASVAADKLGEYDLAIELMGRKKLLIDSKEYPEEVLNDHLYRYYANLGTHNAHRWLANGADRRDISDLQQAEKLIEYALEINPEAHFGREEYQLHAIRWIMDPPEDEGMGIATISEFSFKGKGRVNSGNPLYSEAAEGLSGLIQLGGAWESLDIYVALAEALGGSRDNALGFQAILRARELRESGAASLHPLISKDEESLDEYLDIKRLLPKLDMADVRLDAETELHRRLSKEAADWHARQIEFMNSKLLKGQHPDTHQDFWENAPSNDVPDVEALYPSKTIVNLKVFLFDDQYVGARIIIGVGLLIISAFGLTNYFQKRFRRAA